MPRFISDDEVEGALHWLNNNAAVAAKARAERQYVEDYAKVLKARIMREHPGKSGIAQETEAYVDPRYLQHLEAIRQAVVADETQRFLRDAKLALIESWRTQSSNERTRI